MLFGLVSLFKHKVNPRGISVHHAAAAGLKQKRASRHHVAFLKQ